MPGLNGIELHRRLVELGSTELRPGLLGSLGILGMRDRALLIGGELTLRGVAGQGTLVVLRIPLPY